MIYALSGCSRAPQAPPVPATAPATAPEPPATAPEPPPTAPEPPPTPGPPPQEYYNHKVRWWGESLSIIAAWYTGDLQNWKLLAEANPHLPNPNRIYQGDVIRIPIDLMKTKEPMPQDFIEKFITPSPLPQAPPEPKPPPSPLPPPVE
jgi:hypothetical protein